MEIAVIGAGIIAAGATQIHQLRRNLISGRDLVRSFPEHRRSDSAPLFNMSRFYPHLHPTRQPTFAKGAFLDNIDLFCPENYRISPNEAKVMDPSQRLFLKAASQAIEGAGYQSADFVRTKTGVFVGYMPDFRPFNYRDLINLTNANEHSVDQVLTPNLISAIPSRVSYFLDLSAPTVTIDTSCSSSLIAIKLACESLERGESEVALAGSVKINLAPLLSAGRAIIESHDFRSKVFDASANGVGIGEGAGVVLLKPLRRALADGDYIWGVVRAAGSNQDGRSGGMAAPNGAAQTRLMKQTWADAGVAPFDIGYVEAHGTGTAVGDPVELTSIIEALREADPASPFQHCGVGSVKANYGHWYEAAGILSFLKTVLSVHYREVYPQIHLRKLSPQIDLLASPVFIPLEHQDWPKPGAAIAGINAFGVSGTNAHLLVEAPPSSAPSVTHRATPSEPAVSVFPLSAATPDLLRRTVEVLADWLRDSLELPLASICHTAAAARPAQAMRLAIAARSTAELLAQFDMLRRLDRMPVEGVILNAELCPRPILRSVQRFLDGGAPEWSGLDAAPGRVPLPAYAIAERRFWVDVPDRRHRPADSVRHFKSGWKRIHFPPSDVFSAGRTLVIRSASPEARSFTLADGLIAELEEGRARSLDELSPDELVAADTVIFLPALDCAGLETSEDLERDLRNTLFPLFELMKALSACRGARSKQRLVIPISGAVELGPSDPVTSPQAACMIGLGRVFDREFSSVNVWAIDIGPDQEPACLARASAANFPTYLTAVRGDSAFAATFEPLLLPAVVKSGLPPLDPDATYLITGGTGGLGLALAARLVEMGARRLLLASKSGRVGPQHEAQLEKLSGVNVAIEIAAVDFGDQRATRAYLDALAAKGQRLAGIIHAAGVPGSHIIGKQSEQEFRRVLDCKVAGTFALGSYAEKNPLDFLIFYSSVAVHFPAIGQGDYAAANWFLDSYTSYLRAKGIAAYAVDWVAWKEVGMAADLGSNVNTTFRAIETAAGLDALFEALDNDVPCCLIGELNREPSTFETLSGYRLLLHPGMEPLCSVEHGEEAAPAKAAAPTLSAEPSGRPPGQTYSSWERRLAQVWGEVLGYEKVPINEDVYNLGADSLAMVRFATIVEGEFHTTIDLAQIIDCSTIAALAAQLGALDAAA